MKKKLIYTVLTGDYDTLCTIKHEPNTDYYCFTNNPKLKSKDWNIQYIENKEKLSNKELSRKYKILGVPEYEKKYDVAIYIDANIHMHKSFDEILKENCDFNKYQIYFFKHNERSNTYEEAEECIRLQLDNPALIRTQMDYYKRHNFPSDTGLVAAMMIIRKINNKKNDPLSLMLKEWYHQYHQFSKRDQLSVMYSLWKYHISYGVLNQNPYASDWMTIQTHNVPRKITSINPFGNGICNELGLKEEKNKYSPDKEDYHCHIEDLNDSHSSIARRVKPNSKVLDIGCGVGIIGELLFKNKNCINYGVEIDPESSKVAQNSNYYKKVFNISIENPEERKLIEKEGVSFDYIILADTLEHMVNPGETLYQVSKMLSKNGKLLVSVPNVAYFDIIRGLIDNEFNYQKTGILDNTHLHFFTKKSFIEMIANWRITYQTNFDVEWFDSTKVTEEKQELLLGQLLDSNGEHLVVQNIYELSRLEDDDIPIKMINELNKRKNNSYLEINQKLMNDAEKNEQIKVELEEKIKHLEEEKNLMLQELQSIIQSKSWKITKPLRAMVGKFSKQK